MLGIDFNPVIALSDVEGLVASFWIFIGFMGLKYILTVVVSWPQVARDYRKHLPLELKDKSDKLKSRWYLTIFIFLLMIIPVVVLPSVILYVLMTLFSHSFGWLLASVITMYVVHIVLGIIQAIHEGDSITDNPDYSVFNIQYSIYKYCVSIFSYTPSVWTKYRYEQKILNAQNKVLLNE